LIISILDPSANVTSTISSTVFGPILTMRLDPWKKYGPPFISSDDIKLVTEKIGIERLNTMIEQRSSARKAKNFEESDRIRNKLKALGIELEDKKDGRPIWKVMPG
ncbi:MAG TPA: hypothetical protein VE801_09890, partial [Xanthobacteraceae bacterium]|nr:hypothetical protein [Xanthobacteraceae bacterium]